MFENSIVPFTIIRENNVDATGNQHNQYQWKKELKSPDELSYLIENVSLLQEPTETLNMSVTLSHVTPEYRADCHMQCSECSGTRYFECRNCRCWRTTHVSKYTCLNNKGNITYELRIDFHNLLHHFGCDYSYEVVCKSSGCYKPDEYLFTCVKPRSDKIIVFQKRYAATTYNENFDLSSSDFYFGIRRLKNPEGEVYISRLLRVISTLQNIDDEGTKVILQAKDGWIAVHNFILLQYSDVFRAMFAHKMREKQSGVVGIPDFDIKVTKKIVDYLYTGKLGNVTGMIEGLFKFAHRYQIHELCRRCEEYYIFNVLPGNDKIIDILELVDLYELNELKTKAEKFMHCHQKALSTLPRYQKYLCESINICKAVGILTLADKYDMEIVKTSVLNFIKVNYKKMVQSEDFLKLFESNSRLMKEVYIFSTQENV